MAVSEAIDRLRSEIQQNLIEWKLGNDANERWLAPQDLATKTLNSQLLDLFRLLSGDNWTTEDKDRRKEYCKVLLILLRSNCNDEDLRRFQEKVVRDGGLRDLDLPVDEARAIDEFGQVLGATFSRKQFIFCAVKLKDGEETRYLGKVKQDCPLPFGNREKLGGGSSGAVYKVKVLASHFCSKEYGMGPNEEPLFFAWKEFRQCKDSEEAYRIERENLETISHSPDYLSDPRTFIPELPDDVEFFLCRFKGLVGALNFLHTKLIARDTEENLCFAHLDLRPANILIFNKGVFGKALGTENIEKWKIHDFGVSRIRREARPPKRVAFKWLLPGAPEDQASPAHRSWPEGTFYAPETQHGIGNKVTGLKPASDIWSLGCILSLVISFLDKGSKSIEEFQRRRGSTNSTKDPFYVKKGENWFLNPGVVEWLAELEKNIKDKRELMVALVVRDTILLLKKCLLVIKPERRANSEELERTFRKGILSRFQDLGPRNRGVKADLSHLIDHFKNKPSDAMKDPTPPPIDFPLEGLPKESSSCKYSLRGDYLAFLSAREIALYKVSGVLCKNADRVPQSRKPVHNATWGGFDLCSKYLVAYTKQPYLDFYLYPHSPRPLTDPPTMYREHFFNEDLPPIRSISLSPNGEYLVMVLRRDYGPYDVYSCRVKDIQEMSETPEPTWSPFQPFRSRLLKPIDSKSKTQLEISHVESVQFSEDSKLIALLSQPAGSSTQIFYGWSLNETNGNHEYVNKITFTRPGNIDTSETWLTAFIPLMPKLSILRVTFQRVLGQSGFTNASRASDWKSQELKLQILDILPLAHTDRHCIFIGREKRKQGTIKALYAEVHGLRDKMEKVHFDYVLDLQCSDWVPGRDSASTLFDGEVFLVSTAGESGFIREVFRPKAPII